MAADLWRHGTPKYGPPEGRGFTFPDDVIKALGEGDAALRRAIIAEIFGGHVMDCLLISANAVREIGNGDPAAGRKILHRFVMKLRAQ